jgi:TetR/AcrR family transcriptional regulator
MSHEQETKKNIPEITEPHPHQCPCFHRATKEKILKAAVELFGQHGLNGVSVAELARSADVNKALIFYYFGSKDNLYLAAFRSLIEEIASVMAQTFARTEPGLYQIEQLVRAHTAFIGSHPYMVRFMIRELMLIHSGEDSQLLPEMSRVMAPIRNALSNAIAAGQEKGEIRAVDPLHTIVNILSLDVFFFAGKPLVSLLHPGINTAKFEQERADHIIDLLMNGLRTPGVSS